MHNIFDFIRSFLLLCTQKIIGRDEQKFSGSQKTSQKQRMGILFVVNEVVKQLPRDPHILESWGSLFGNLVHSLANEPDLRDRDRMQMFKVRVLWRVCVASRTIGVLLQWTILRLRKLHRSSTK